ncbi:MAG: galactose ABC transporter substrate-binding protein [Clostridia bacterium]|nr:galactose ABC transporter substrate-binding protein [Clostridia bacterium]
MKKLFALMLVAIMALSCTLAFAETPESLDIRALIWKYDDTYGSTVRAAMEKWAAYYSEEMGIDISLQMYDAADDMAKQIEQATILCGEMPDFVIINLAEVTNGQVLVDMFTEAGIPFLFYNKQPAEDTVQSVLVDTGTIFIGTLARQAGDMQGEILAELYAADSSIDLNGDGVLQYAMLMGEPQNDEAIARTRYSVETAEANGLVLEQIGETMVCNWDQAMAQDAITALFAANPNIEVIFGNNDMMCLGAVAALNGYGYNTGIAGDPNVVVIGVDAVDSALESIKTGGMTATVQQDGDAMGRANIRIAINGALGLEWLDGTDYEYTDDPYHCIRIPYAKITEVE